MSQSQGIEVRRPSRRTIATGAAWAVPVIAVGAAAPAMAASGNICVPDFTVELDKSFKCCNTAVKNMKLVIKVTDPNNCIGATSNICIQDVTVATGNVTIKQKIGVPSCAVENGEYTIYLLDVSNCSVNLLVTFTIDGGPAQVVPLKSGNIPGGNTSGDCQP